AAGTSKGREVLDSPNPSTLGVGAATPVATQAALTAEDATVIDATYGAPEEGVLNNVRTRLGEIEAALQAFGLIA
ncbi:MAG: hypothetical protein V3U63_01630, partial [Gemmatimonadota bacterium]